MNKILKLLNKLILKYHKCENNQEIVSVTYKTIGNIKICGNIETRCSICGG